MEYEIPREVVSESEEFFEYEGIPLLRPAKPGEERLILGWSLAQEKPVLLSRNVEDGEDYQPLAEAATKMLPDSFPTTLTCEGDIVCKVGHGFYDVYGDRTAEITIEEAWHSSLLQFWLDMHKLPICIRPSINLEDEKVIRDHAELASYSFDRSIRYAAFKEMGIRHAIREYVRECWLRDRRLPKGAYTLTNGVVVTFPNTGGSKCLLKDCAKSEMKKASSPLRHLTL